MLWVTRRAIRVNRTATAWLVRRFVDPGAIFCFVDPGEVERVQRAHGAIGFDAPAARYPHRDPRGRCSFEALVEEYCPTDAALQELARIVHAADFPGEDRITSSTGQSRRTLDVLSLTDALRPAPTRAVAPEAIGLRAISRGFPLVAGDDRETLDRSAFLYDALYASLRERLT